MIGMFYHIAFIYFALGLQLRVAALLALTWRDLGPHLLPVRERVLAVAPLARLMKLGVPIGLALALFWLAVATDLVDGRLARARRQTSVFGMPFSQTMVVTRKRPVSGS